MIHVAMGDEEKVLGNGALGTPADVEGQSECGEDDAGLLPTNGEPLHGVPLDL